MMNPNNNAVFREAVVYPYLYLRNGITLGELEEKISIDTLLAIAITEEIELRATYLLDLKKELLK